MPDNLFIENRYSAFEKTVNSSFQEPSLYSIKKRRTRLLVRKGTENVLLRLEDIVLFYTENKIVYVIDKLEKKYFIDSHLSGLEDELNPLLFFRANRQYIININFIKSFKAYEKVKIKIDLNIPELNYCIIISQETAPVFRKWIREA